jgi:hypothetical protein
LVKHAGGPPAPILAICGMKGVRRVVAMFDPLVEIFAPPIIALLLVIVVLAVFASRMSSARRRHAERHRRAEHALLTGGT